MNILYEDNHLIAVNKPAGILTQPNDTQDASLEVALKEWIKIKYQKPGNVFLGVVHRLDRPVSGVVIFAKTSKALSRLNTAFRSKECRKTYYALVEGCPPTNSGVLEHDLLHDEHHSKVVSAKTTGAKHARLTYNVLKKSRSHAWLEIELETGRYHQIRVQLAAIGCPVVGDQRYGSREFFRQRGIALHHGRFEIKHPTQPILVELEAPLPEDLAKLLEKTFQD